MPLLLTALALLALAASLYLLWKARWGKPCRDLPGVLTFHKVTGFEFGGTWMTPRRFERMLDSLLGSGYSFIGEDRFLECLDGKVTAGDKEVLLTFDDGYSMLSDSAVPALRERNIPALFFMVTSYAGRENSWELSLPGRRSVHMGWDEVESISSDPLFTFGSHSRSHRDLTRLSDEQLSQELEVSRQVIGHYTGREPRTISYPFGRVDARVAEATAGAGYDAAFTLYPGGRADRTDRMSLRREGVWIIDTPATVRAKLSRGRAFWFEDVKGRAINAVASITPLFSRKSPFE